VLNLHLCIMWRNLLLVRSHGYKKGKIEFLGPMAKLAPNLWGRMLARWCVENVRFVCPIFCADMGLLSRYFRSKCSEQRMVIDQGDTGIPAGVER
jgi:hypothetical protein